MSPEAELYRQALEQAGRTRAEAERMHERALKTTREVAPRAKEAGVTVAEIARLLGVTTRRVYAVLQEP
jgi:hypothetical protein